jgi:hypothetical protein
MKRRPKPPVPEENLVADAAEILQIKVWLTGISPMVWRRALVPASFTLHELHGVIQIAMGWERASTSTISNCAPRVTALGRWRRRHPT